MLSFVLCLQGHSFCFYFVCQKCCEGGGGRWYGVRAGITVQFAAVYMIVYVCAGGVYHLLIGAAGVMLAIFPWQRINCNLGMEYILNNPFSTCTIINPRQT